MKPQLTLEHIAPYLPYGLKGMAKEKTSIDLLLGVYGTGGHSLTLCYMVNPHNTVDYDCNIQDFKPILHPLSDLTKPITVEGYNDGKEFVPIVELAKIAFPNGRWSTSTESGTATNTDSTFKDKFVFRDNTFSCRQAAINGDYHKVPNQLQLFQMLYKWHIDLHGLIEKDLAISINDLMI